MKSKNPSKQRKAIYKAKLHEKHKLISANLDKSLRQEYNRRSMFLRTGDNVKVMKGQFRGLKGTVAKIDLKKYGVYISGLKRKKADGKEVNIKINASNLKILELVLDDEKRIKILNRGK